MLRKSLYLLCILGFLAVGTAKGQAPVITPKIPVTLKLGENGTKTITYVDVADISGLTPNSTVTVTPSYLTCSSLGPQTITVTAGNGSPASTSTRQIQVTVASLPEFAIYPDANILADSITCKATLPNYTINAHVSDICPGAHLTLKQEPVAGTPLIINVPTLVTLTATDQYGGISAVIFTVTSYNLPAIFSKPDPITLHLDDNGKYTVKTEDLGAVFSCDGSIPAITISPQNLSCSNLGAQAITLKANTLRSNPQAVTFFVPTDVALDAAGNIYVADGYGCSIRKIATSGAVTTFAGGTCGFADDRGTAAKFDVLLGITIDSQGNLFAIDANNRVRKITPDGTVTTLAGNGQNTTVDGQGANASFSAPRGIAIDADGNLYITQLGDFLVRKVTPTGNVTTITPLPAVSGLNTPIGITTDASGNVYVTDYSSAIKKISPDGIVTTIAGHNGTGFTDGQGAAASFNQPKGIARDNLGNLYITDSGNNAIRKIDPSGKVTTLPLYITNPNDNASLNNPIGIKIDPLGNFIVVDAANNRIVRITPAGQLSTIAGNGDVGHHNGNVNTPPTIGGETVKVFNVTVLSSTNSSSATNGVSATIGSYPQNATVCEGNPIQFIAVVPPGSYANTYQWQVNGVNAGTNSPFFTSNTFHNGDVVTCITTNDISCTVPKTSLPIITHIIALPEIIFDTNPTINMGGSVTLKPVIHGDIKAFRWSPTLGISNPLIANPVATPGVTTTYDLTVTSAQNCETTVPVTVYVIPPIKVPNTFTPNGDGFNDVWKIDDLATYPNCTVSIYNRYGQVVFHTNGYGKPWDGTLNGRAVPPGTYYYIIDLKNNNKPVTGWVAILR